MQQTRFDPKNLSPAAREGYSEPGVKEYVALGMGTTKHRSVETALTTAGSMRRIANAAGLTTPFVEMTTKDVKALAVAIQNYVNPRSEEPPVVHWLLRLSPGSLESHDASQELRVGSPNNRITKTDGGILRLTRLVCASNRIDDVPNS